VIVVPNFSLGSVLGTALAQFAAPYFDSVEIVEAHHAGKVDSPSGTAVRTAELIVAARAVEGRVDLDAPFADQTARGELIAGVPVHSLRLQGVIARQEVRFGGAGEVLTITHDTHSPDSYRAGIRAALEAIGGSSGLVVGLDRILGIGR
jgi:4-hydroxy-tetrahydrodipicolinate reductase